MFAANARTGADTIVLRGGKPYTLKQEGMDEEEAQTGDLDVTDDLLVKRKGAKVTIDARGVDRVFHLPPLSTANLRLLRLTLTGGTAAAVVADSGDLKLINSKVRGNEHGSPGGGVAVAMPASGTIRRSTISGNSAQAGGGVYAGGMTTIVDSTVSDNQTVGGGGGVKSQSVAFAARNSTFTKNRAPGDGGGISILSGMATFNNITVARNKADTDATGGVDVGGGISAAGTVMVANSVIALNKLGGEPMPIVDVNCDGTFVSEGGNVRGTDDLGCLGFMGTDDRVDAQPRLGPLDRNGGPTKTIALKKGSPAINNAIPGSAQPKDQRGVKRGAKPDSGAYERR